MPEYTFDNVWIHARQRLRGLEQLLDPGTIRHLEALGVAEGWHCPEVGAGGGSITEWLCRRLGADGFVMATDRDTRFLGALAMSNLEVRRHDVVADPLPERSFDLVRSRLVLEHVHEREKALQHMLAARGHVYCGRYLYGYLRALGLTDIGAEGRVPVLFASSAPAQWKRLSVEQVAKDIVRAQLATEAEVEAYLALLESAGFAAQGFTVITAWGRRPT